LTQEGWEVVLRVLVLLPTDDPLEQEGPAMAPLLLFLEEPEAGAWAGQKQPEALCAKNRPS
jgi:hypothetical protein